jgi:GntR family transcriptional regulator
MAPVSDTLYRQEEAVAGPKKQPLYRQIQNRLRDDIIGGTYGISEKLPSEHDLMDLFGASRVTVRRALTGLQEDGLIVSRRGEGYFVTRPAVIQDLGRLQGLAEAVGESSHTVRSKVVSAREVEADGPVAEALDLDIGTVVFELKRIRYLNQNPLSFDISYFPLPLGRKLAACDLAEQDIYVLLGDLLDDDLGHADFLIDVAEANDEIAGALGLAPSRPVIHVTRVAYMKSGKPVDFEYLYGMPNAYRFKVLVPRW